jgi:CHRD domain
MKEEQMRHSLLGLLVLVTAVGALALATAAGAGPSGGDNGTMCVFNTRLQPEPGSTSEAKGHAQIKIRNDGTIEYKVFILNKAGEQFEAGHIHYRTDPAAFSGPPLVFLLPSGPTHERQIRDRGEITGQEAVAADICAHPERYYVNYHTTEFFLPIAALRGELA